MTLPEAEIRYLVERVPDDFLPAGTKRQIAEGLLARRVALRGVVESMYGGVQ